jgi:hypothetical protein
MGPVVPALRWTRGSDPLAVGTSRRASSPTTRSVRGPTTTGSIPKGEPRPLEPSLGSGRGRRTTVGRSAPTAGGPRPRRFPGSSRSSSALPSSAFSSSGGSDDAPGPHPRGGCPRGARSRGRRRLGPLADSWLAMVRLAHRGRRRTLEVPRPRLRRTWPRRAAGRGLAGPGRAPRPGRDQEPGGPALGGASLASGAGRSVLPPPRDDERPSSAVWGRGVRWRGPPDRTLGRRGARGSRPIALGGPATLRREGEPRTGQMPRMPVAGRVRRRGRLTGPSGGAEQPNRWEDAAVLAKMRP